MEMDILSMAIYGLKAIPIKFPVTFFPILEKKNLKIYTEIQGPWETKAVLSIKKYYWTYHYN